MKAARILVTRIVARRSGLMGAKYLVTKFDGLGSRDERDDHLGHSIAPETRHKSGFRSPPWRALKEQNIASLPVIWSFPLERPSRVAQGLLEQKLNLCIDAAQLICRPALQCRIDLLIYA